MLGHSLSWQTKPIVPATEENMHTVKIICEQVPEFRQFLKADN